MLKYFFSIFVLVVVLLVTVAGFRGQKFQKPPIEIFPDMDHQPKVKSQVPSTFYADGRANRAPINGTVPLGYAMPQHKMVDGSAGESQSPYKQVQDRIRQMADGEIFNTITHGKNTMMGYGDRIQVQDRWAIITYIRALQKSQGGATINDVPATERAKLESQNP
mgnify:CR=1 FL=1